MYHVVKHGAGCTAFVSPTDLTQLAAKRVAKGSVVLDNFTYKLRIMEEQLIAAVYKRRTLWDPSDKLRRNANILKSLWIELAQELGVDVKAAKNKWKNLRAYFMTQTRELDKQKTDGGGATKISSTWGFYNQLLFLKDAAKFAENARDDSLTSMEAPQISGKIEVDDYDVDNLLNSSVPEITDKNVLPEIISTFSMANKYTSQPGTSNERQAREEWGNNSQIENSNFQIGWPNRNKRKLDTRDEEITESRGREVIEIGKGKVLLLDRETEEDPDMLFFKSLLPYMRELSPIQKLRVRTSIQNLIIAEYDPTM